VGLGKCSSPVRRASPFVSWNWKGTGKAAWSLDDRRIANVSRSMRGWKFESQRQVIERER